MGTVAPRHCSIWGPGRGPNETRASAPLNGFVAVQRATVARHGGLRAGDFGLACCAGPTAQDLLASHGSRSVRPSHRTVIGRAGPTGGRARDPSPPAPAGVPT